MTTPAAHKKNRFGANVYLIPRPGTTQVEELVSVTSMLDVIAKPGLEKWRQEIIAAQFSQRSDLIMLAANPDTRKDAIKQALNATFSAANVGTSIHFFSELIDTDCFSWELVPDVAKPWIDNYLQGREDHKWELVDKEFSVYSFENLYAGTADRFLRIPGYDGVVIADLKGLALNTPIPTPTGWATMQSLQVGDQVFGSDGKPCTVMFKSDTRMRPCYRLAFDDASSIICDDEHRWAVRSGLAGRTKDLVLTTQELFVANQFSGKRPLIAHNRVLNASPLELPEAIVPIDPYVFGVWLGDGRVSNGEVTKPDDELFDLIESCGYKTGPDTSSVDRAQVRTVYGLRTALRLAGLLGFKHIPDYYLRGSASQRLALLQGLMDTDGTWNRARRQASFTSTDKMLSDNVYELVVSLGCRAYEVEVERTGFGLTVMAYDVVFTPYNLNPFRLSRKANLVEHSDSVCARRFIDRVEAIDSIPTQCIAVDSCDNTYLCGEQMVPTHNTGKSVYGDHGLQMAMYAFAEGIWVAPVATPKTDAAMEELARNISAGTNVPPKRRGWSQAAIKACEADIQEAHWEEYSSLGQHKPMPEDLRKDVAFVMHLREDKFELIPLDISGLEPVVAGVAHLNRFTKRRNIVGDALKSPRQIAEEAEHHAQQPDALVQLLLAIDPSVPKAAEEPIIEPVKAEPVDMTVLIADAPVEQDQPLEPATEIPIAPPGPRPVRIKVFRDRIGALPAEAKQKLAFNWPTGTPTFKQSNDQSETQLEELDKLLWEIESQYTTPEETSAAVRVMEDSFPGSSTT